MRRSHPQRRPPRPADRPCAPAAAAGAITFIKDDVYYNVVSGFQTWWVSAVYIIANLALALHLYHGLWSMFNSVGLNHVRFNPWRRTFATAFAVIVALGNISFPIAVLLGVVR